MRIAISGAHFSGKSTLIASLIEELPDYTSVDEAYFLLEEDGYEFSNPPSLEDFEQQLQRSIAVIRESPNNTLFDRCPIDYLAYALALEEPVDIEDWIRRMEGAMELLDLIVFVPIESRIPVPASEDLKLRRNVDAQLQEMLIEDSLGILDTIEVLEVTGSLKKRVNMVKAKITD